MQSHGTGRFLWKDPLQMDLEGVLESEEEHATWINTIALSDITQI